MSRRLLQAFVLSMLLFTPWGEGIAQPRRISLAEALRLATISNPATSIATANVGVATGDLISARARPNPELAGTIGPAVNAETRLTTGQLGVNQVLELGGKRRLRREGASLAVDAAEARLKRQRELVALGVRRAFRLALIARERLATASDADSLGQSLLAAARDRLTLGAGTALEVNVAAAAAARDRRARLVAEQGVTAALYELQAAIGLPASDLVEPDASFSDVVPRALPARSEDSLVVQALTARADLVALARERDAADRGVRLASALRWPNPSIGFGGGNAEDFRVRILSVSLPLPLWNRGEGDRASAIASLSRASVVVAAAQRGAEREVRVAYRALQRALESTSAFEAEVVTRLRENLELANESFRSGKISLFAYTTLRRDLVAARLDYLDALADVAEREYALAAATGERLGGIQ